MIAAIGAFTSLNVGHYRKPRSVSVAHNNPTKVCESGTEFEIRNFERELREQSALYLPEIDWYYPTLFATFEQRTKRRHRLRGLKHRLTGCCQKVERGRFIIPAVSFRDCGGLH
jgi:hypothetical protein